MLVKHNDLDTFKLETAPTYACGIFSIYCYLFLLSILFFIKLYLALHCFSYLLTALAKIHKNTFIKKRWQHSSKDFCCLFGISLHRQSRTKTFKYHTGKDKTLQHFIIQKYVQKQQKNLIVAMI